MGLRVQIEMLVQLLKSSPPRRSIQDPRYDVWRAKVDEALYRLEQEASR